VEPTPDLLRLQRELDEAVGSYMVKTGTAAAFYTTPEEPNIIPALVDATGHYMEDNGGDKFSPHVTTGMEPKPISTRCSFRHLYLLPNVGLGLSVWRLRDRTEDSEGLPRQRLRSSKINGGTTIRGGRPAASPSSCQRLSNPWHVPHQGLYRVARWMGCDHRPIPGHRRCGG
jgi:hypothetical protein